MFPQSTILDPIFWMVFGAIQLWVFNAARIWAAEQRLGMNWWKWLVTGCWWLLFNLTVNASFVLLAENEGAAGWYILGLFGTVLLVAGAIWLRVLLTLRQRAAL